MSAIRSASGSFRVGPVRAHSSRSVSTIVFFSKGGVRSEHSKSSRLGLGVYLLPVLPEGVVGLEDKLRRGRFGDRVNLNPSLHLVSTTWETVPNVIV